MKIWQKRVLVAFAVALLYFLMTCFAIFGFPHFEEWSLSNRLFWIITLVLWSGYASTYPFSNGR